MKYATKYGDTFFASSDHDIETYLRESQRLDTYDSPIFFRKTFARRAAIAYGARLRWLTTKNFVSDLIEAGIVYPLENN